MRHYDHSAPCANPIDAEPARHRVDQAWRDSYNFHWTRVRTMSAADCKAELGELRFIVNADPARVKALEDRIEYAR